MVVPSPRSLFLLKSMHLVMFPNISNYWCVFFFFLCWIIIRFFLCLRKSRIMSDFLRCPSSCVYICMWCRIVGRGNCRLFNTWLSASSEGLQELNFGVLLGKKQTNKPTNLSRPSRTGLCWCSGIKSSNLLHDSFVYVNVLGEFVICYFSVQAFACSACKALDKARATLFNGKYANPSRARSLVSGFGEFEYTHILMQKKKKEKNEADPILKFVCDKYRMQLPFG